MRVQVTGGGTANWSTPVRADANTWRANYETFIVHRYTFEDGRQIHVRTRYAGIDDVDETGFVFASIGSFEGMDDDGHWNHGRIDWDLRPEEYKATYNFLYGTGKWEDASGSITARVWAEPEEFGQVMPPTGPIRFWGHLEGEGELELPNFNR